MNPPDFALPNVPDTSFVAQVGIEFIAAYLLACIILLITVGPKYGFGWWIFGCVSIPFMLVGVAAFAALPAFLFWGLTVLLIGAPLVRALVGPPTPKPAKVFDGLN